jgi:serine/threonine protein kinase/Tfp pilus assembly protein PilF
VVTADWRRLKEAFHRASELDGEELRAFLAEQGRDHPAVHERLLAMLASHREQGSLLDRRAPNLPATPAPAPALTEIGPYAVERLLGSGGMGEVHLGVRADRVFEKKVAIKLLRGAFWGEEAGRRFRIERQILAQLEHPNIARLLDGGTASDGRPYLVMELVDGEPIDRYCREHALNLKDRVRLLVKVCAAVNYAHQNLVVHRDLKPANILVGKDGEPKLLDFGIAKLIGDDQAEAQATQKGQRPMTPEYASPEQIDGRMITTATDVYALGVLLYQLVTGGLPFEPPADGQIADWLRAVREREATLPSVRLLEKPATPDDGAAAEDLPRVERLRWARALRGDLDTIVAKALRKDPSRRYASAEQLAEDLRAYLEGRPIRARADTLGYLFGKWVRRNPGLASAILALFLLAVGLVVATAELLAQRDRLALEQRKSKQVADFAVELFEVNDPGEALGRTITARDLLARGAAKAKADLADQPEVRAEMLDVVGLMYFKLGLIDEAAPLLEDARAAAAEAYGTDDPKYAGILDNLAGAKREAGQLDRAEAMMRQALEIRRRSGPKDAFELAESLNNLGVTRWRQGDRAEARRLIEEALAITRQARGERDPEVASALNNLAVIDFQDNRTESAIALLDRSLAINRELLPANHPTLSVQLGNLAQLHRRRGDLRATEALLAESVVIAAAAQGEEHLTTRGARHTHGLLLAVLGEWPAARRELELSLHPAIRAFEVPAVGEFLPDDLAHLNSYVQCLIHLGALEEAAARMDQADASRPAFMAEELALVREQNRARWLIARGAAQAAVDRLRPLLEGQLSQRRRHALLLELARAHRQDGHLELAQAAIDQAGVLQAKLWPAENPEAGRLELLTAQLELDRGLPAEARARLERQRSRWADALGPASCLALEAGRWLDPQVPFPVDRCGPFPASAKPLPPL